MVDHTSQVRLQRTSRLGDGEGVLAEELTTLVFPLTTAGEVDEGAVRLHAGVHLALRLQTHIS